MEREKRGLMNRLQRNMKRMITRPLRRKEPREFSDEEITDLVEFTGLDREAVVSWLRREGTRRVSNEFDWIAPSNEHEYAWFYRGNRSYVFQADEAWERAIEVAQPGWRCLDFGGGGGRNGLGMAGKGAKAFYVDIGIVNAAFTRFRARKKDLDLTVLDPMVDVDGTWKVDTVEAARRAGPYDLIVADNVLEHIPDYHTVVKRLSEALSPTGRFLECTPFKREKTYLLKKEEEWDIHLKPSMPMSEAMAAAGMRAVAGEPEGLWERATG